MTDAVDHAVRFFDESDFWRANLEHLEDPDVVFHEANVETSLHPVSLEYLMVEYLSRRGLEIRNVGHAVHKGTAWMKIHPREGPVFNLVWRFNPDVVIQAAESPFTTWTRSGNRDYMERFRTRAATDEDRLALEEYFASEHWREALDKMADPEIEHFHVYYNSDIDPLELDKRFKEAEAAAGHIINVPTFFLGLPEDHSMWIGHAVDGCTSWEFAIYHTPGVDFAPKQPLTEEEHEYGADGWSVDQFKRFIAKDPYDPLTRNEVHEILGHIDPGGYRSHDA